MIQRFDAFVTGITVCYKYIQRIKSAEVTDMGLKGAHVMCMFHLKQHPEGLTASQLCTLCAEDKAAVSRILTELEETGMVRREQRNGSRYRASLFLTEKGQLAAAAVVEKARLAVELAGAGFGEEEREVFYRVLSIIAGNLHRLCKTGLGGE